MNHVYQTEFKNFNAWKTVLACKNDQIHWDLGWHRLRSENLSLLFTIYLTEKTRENAMAIFPGFWAIENGLKMTLGGRTGKIRGQIRTREVRID